MPPRHFAHLDPPGGLDEEANVEDVKTVEETRDVQQVNPEPQILEEICVEELAIDGICGVY